MCGAKGANPEARFPPLGSRYSIMAPESGTPQAVMCQAKVDFVPTSPLTSRQSVLRLCANLA
jgi:hypothetical protein